MPVRERYLFGDLALDVPERLLSTPAGTIALAPKAFDVLVHLVRNAGRLVTKQELLDEVWAGAHLSISMSYWNQHRFEEAIVWATKTLELDPRHLVAREHLAAAYWALGDMERHIAESVAHD